METNKLICVGAWLMACCIWTSSAGHDDVISNLVARIDALETQGKQQGVLISAQAGEIGALQSVVHEQTFTIREQKDKLSHHESIIREQMDKLSHHDAIIREQKDKLSHHEAIIREQKDKLSHHETIIKELKDWKEAQQMSKTHEQSAMDNDDSNDQRLATPKNINSIRRDRRIVMEGPVAFHAVIPDGEHPKLGLNQKIVFDHVLNNLGGGYHNQHGLFIAPQAGIYIFSTSILSYTHSSDSLQVSIMKNGVILGGAFAHSDTGRYDQGSVSVVTQLASGDEVWVSHRYGSTESIWGDYYSSFMGCLIMYV